MKFKVGDRVRVARKHSSFNSFGKMDCWIGKVMTISGIWLRRAYSMKEDKGEFAWHEDCLEPVNDTIIINHNGNTVTAIDKSTNKKGIARCNPSDTFDLYTGSRLALDRLFGMEEKKEEKSEFLTKFEKGKRYKFDLSQYLKQRKKKDISAYGWEKKCIGKEVTFDNEETGEIDGFGIHCKWCVEIPQVREVKRPAKVGEWIKVVNAIFTGGFYGNNEILPVTRTANLYAGVYASKNGKELIPSIADEEYVVLENYTPSEPEPVKETFYNGKVVCVDKNGNHGLYTTGKIYEFIDGQMVCNNRSKFPSIKIHSFDEWQVLSSAKWLEIKE